MGAVLYKLTHSCLSWAVIYKSIRDSRLRMNWGLKGDEESLSIFWAVIRDSMLSKGYRCISDGRRHGFTESFANFPFQHLVLHAPWVSDWCGRDSIPIQCSALHLSPVGLSGISDGLVIRAGSFLSYQRCLCIAKYCHTAWHSIAAPFLWCVDWGDDFCVNLCKVTIEHCSFNGRSELWGAGQLDGLYRRGSCCVDFHDRKPKQLGGRNAVNQN